MKETSLKAPSMPMKAPKAYSYSTINFLRDLSDMLFGGLDRADYTIFFSQSYLGPNLAGSADEISNSSPQCNASVKMLSYAIEVNYSIRIDSNGESNNRSQLQLLLAN